MEIRVVRTCKKVDVCIVRKSEKRFQKAKKIDTRRCQHHHHYHYTHLKHGVASHKDGGAFLIETSPDVIEPLRVSRAAVCKGFSQCRHSQVAAPAAVLVFRTELDVALHVLLVTVRVLLILSDYVEIEGYCSSTVQT